jgi:hypothetical protein
VSERKYVAMPTINWQQILATVFSSDGKTSMKAEKAIKRAVKLALSDATGSDASKKEFKKQLQDVLSRYDDILFPFAACF